MSGALVLVVDDDPRLASFVVDALRAMYSGAGRIDVATAAAPSAALPILERASAYDRVLVLSDFNMGSEMNGAQLLAHVAATLPRARRVLMTGYARADLEAQTREAALDAWLAKPFGLADLRHVVDDALGRAAA